MSTVNEVVVRYLAAWNEREPKKRRELVAKTWTEDGTYVDAARDGKQLEQAITLYQRALKLKPDWDEGLWNLGSIAYDLDRYSECAPAGPLVAAHATSHLRTLPGASVRQ